MQRVRVGMTGLASVVLLIGLASVIFSSANRETPVDAVGAPKPEVVANIATVGNAMPSEDAKPAEPLAEIGVAPSTSPTEAANSADSAERKQAGQ